MKFQDSIICFLKLPSSQKANVQGFQDRNTVLSDKTLMDSTMQGLIPRLSRSGNSNIAWLSRLCTNPGSTATEPRWLWAGDRCMSLHWLTRGMHHKTYITHYVSFHNFNEYWCTLYIATRTTTTSTTTKPCPKQNSATSICTITLANVVWFQQVFHFSLSRSGNSMEMRQPDIELGEFRRLLKTFLFTWDIGAWWLLFSSAL